MYDRSLNIFIFPQREADARTETLRRAINKSGLIKRRRMCYDTVSSLCKEYVAYGGSSCATTMSLPMADGDEHVAKSYVAPAEI